MIDSLAAPTAAAQPGIDANAGSGASVISSDFETFLKMLTAQARNQDPLEPLDSSEYSAQLAQFSMVEQQVQTNNLLAALAAQMGATDLPGLASWLGTQVRSEAPAHFDGAPITVLTPANDLADQATLVIIDETGATVGNRAVATGGDSVLWDGTDAAGAPLPAGQYRFVVDHFRDGQLISQSAGQTYGTVAEAALESGEVVLILEGGQAIFASAVAAVRAGT